MVKTKVLLYCHMLIIVYHNMRNKAKKIIVEQHREKYIYLGLEAVIETWPQ